MKDLMSLIRRNNKIFYRSRGNLFFALMMVIIILLLHFLFLQDMVANDMMAIFEKMPGSSVERSDVLFLVDSQLFAATIPMGAVSISLIALGLVVIDRDKNLMSDFLVSPIRRNNLMMSYLISSFFVGLVIILALLTFFEVYFVARYGISFTLVQMLMLFGMTLLTLSFANVFVLVILSLIKSEQALSGLTAVFGIVLGFLSGAYMPVGIYGESVKNIFSALPFLQLTSLFRKIFWREMSNVTALTESMIRGEGEANLAKFFGVDLTIGNTELTSFLLLLAVVVYTAVCLLFVSLRFAHMKKAD